MIASLLVGTFAPPDQKYLSQVLALAGVFSGPAFANYHVGASQEKRVALMHNARLVAEDFARKSSQIFELGGILRNPYLARVSARRRTRVTRAGYLLCAATCICIRRQSPENIL
jgi:hypothetical protein